jgi:hypothetical protein
MDVPPDAIEQWYAARAAKERRTAGVVAAQPREALE